MTNKPDPVDKPALLDREESTTSYLVELTHRILEAANRRDFDAMARSFTPNGVWDMTPLGMGLFEGHEAIRTFMADWIGAYEDYTVKAEDVHDLGGVTFGLLVQQGRPFGGGGFVSLRYVSVSTWRNGLVERSTQYTDLDEGRAAAERIAQERGWAVSHESS
jgi:ketosteroid isomerase-like protein